MLEICKQLSNLTLVARMLIFLMSGAINSFHGSFEWMDTHIFNEHQDPTLYQSLHCKDCDVEWSPCASCPCWSIRCWFETKLHQSGGEIHTKHALTLPSYHHMSSCSSHCTCINTQCPYQVKNQYQSCELELSTRNDPGKHNRPGLVVNSTASVRACQLQLKRTTLC